MNEEVNKIISPEKILEQLEIRDNAHVADFGSGAGFYTIPLAKMIPQGKVYALDVLKDSLEAVNSRAKLEDIQNIETIHCNLEIYGGSKLNDNSIDLVLMRNILFQSQKKKEIIKEAKRVMKKEGQLVIVEWTPNSSFAPKEGWFVSKEGAERLIEAEGLVLDKELEVDNHHYGLVFEKNF